MANICAESKFRWDLRINNKRKINALSVDGDADIFCPGIGISFLVWLLPVSGVRVRATRVLLFPIRNLDQLLPDDPCHAYQTRRGQ